VTWIFNFKLLGLCAWSVESEQYESEAEECAPKNIEVSDFEQDDVTSKWHFIC
jgi:hypothetical protein